jgi:hypothetical protein
MACPRHTAHYSRNKSARGASDMHPCRPVRSQGRRRLKTQAFGAGGGGAALPGRQWKPPKSA